MALSWKLTWRAWMSHCFFEPERFDEVRFSGNWVFARCGKGYVGIYSQNGMVAGADGQYAGRELQCAAAENTWLVECGREADWGSFDAFVAALTGAAIDVEGRRAVLPVARRWAALSPAGTWRPPSMASRSSCVATRWSIAPGHSRHSAQAR